MDNNVNDDDDYFLADDLDDLPANTLQDLEYRAILSTQQHANSVALPRRQPYGQHARRNIGTSNRQPPTRNESATTGSIEVPDGSDYGFDDEDVINLDEPSTIYDTALRPSRDRDKSIVQNQQSKAIQNDKNYPQSYELAHRAGDNSHSPYPSNGYASITEARNERLEDNEKAKNPIDLQKRVEEVLLHAVRYMSLTDSSTS